MPDDQPVGSTLKPVFENLDRLVPFLENMPDSDLYDPATKRYHYTVERAGFREYGKSWLYIVPWPCCNRKRRGVPFFVEIATWFGAVRDEICFQCRRRYEVSVTPTSGGRTARVDWYVTGFYERPRREY